ncbi:MAG: hypothetical protein WCE75_02710 [Terracidiphilus sp.]
MKSRIFIFCLLLCVPGAALAQTIVVSFGAQPALCTPASLATKSSTAVCSPTSSFVASSYSWSGTLAYGSGGPNTGGKVSLADQLMIKPIDDSSTALLIGLLKGVMETGNQTNSMLIAVYRSTSDLSAGVSPVYTVLLSLLVVPTELRALDSTGSTPQEFLSVAFEEIQVTVNTINSTGKVTATYTYTYNRKTNTLS